MPGEPVECLGYFTWRFTIWGGILYFLERVLREVRARKETKIVGVLMHPSGAMEMRFQKPSFRYKPGQWLFLQVPEVSKFQWVSLDAPLCSDMNAFDALLWSFIASFVRFSLVELRCFIKIIV